MSGRRKPYPRNVSRVSDSKKRKLSTDETSKLSPEPFDFDIFAPIDSQMKIIEDAQSSTNEYRDLFGELIPDVKRGNTSTPKTKSKKKTLVTKSKRKSLRDIVLSKSLRNTSRIIPPAPNMVGIMKDAKDELRTLMSINKSSSDVSALSDASLNVSGVKLLDESNSNVNNSKNEKESSEILKGVGAFVDYKIKNDQSVSHIIELLIMLGANVEKTFNHKVTHVVFHDGSLETYKTAIERKIPLVTSKWVENSHLAHKMMDPSDYTPIDMEKYTKSQEICLIIPDCNEQNKSLGQSNNESNIKNRNKFDDLLDRIDDFRSKNCNADSIKTPKLRKPVKNLDKIMNGFSEHLYDVLNDKDSPYYDTEVVTERYVPMSIKILRKYIIPKGNKNKSPSEINNHLIEIENGLKLNSRARQRLRRLLFSSNNDLNNTIVMTDFPKFKEHQISLEKGSCDSNSECKYLLERIEYLKEKFLSVESFNTPEFRKPVINIDKIMKGLSKHVYDMLNEQDKPHFDTEEVCESNIPVSIKILRKYIIPKETENKSISEIKNHLIAIENKMKLDFLARRRLRRLLFNSNKEIYHKIIKKDFPSTSPEKLNNSAPARLTSIENQKLLLGNETLRQDNNLRNMDEIPEKQTTTMETIACTGFPKKEINTLKLSIQNLGTFNFQTKMERSTTHLITKSQPNRTLNMVFAMAYGCKIVSENWVHESHKIGRWLPCEHYLLPDLSSPVKEFQIIRKRFGLSSKFNIFNGAGSIYISKFCEPSANNLKKLVRVCGGKCTSILTKANIVVGETTKMAENNIHETWILDCITHGTLLNKDQYMIFNNNIEP